MRILIFQHARHEHLGLFAELLARYGDDVVVEMIAESRSTIDLNDFDALWVLGGAMQIWEIDRYPWMARELALIRDAVITRQMPYFGICLGHQLLAKALGGEVGPMPQTEVGLHPVTTIENAKMFKGFSKPILSFHWHGAEVTTIPKGATVTASSDTCAIQGLEWNNTACSVQFHPEVNKETIKDWFQLPETILELKSELGPGADAQLLHTLALADGSLRESARILCQNWKENFCGN